MEPASKGLVLLCAKTAFEGSRRGKINRIGGSVYFEVLRAPRTDCFFVLNDEKNVPETLKRLMFQGKFSFIDSDRKMQIFINMSRKPLSRGFFYVFRFHSHFFEKEG